MEKKQKSETKLKELSEIERKRERQEILEFQKESAQQYEKNKQYYEKNRAIYRNSIRKLTEKLRICLETQDETFPEMATHGKINPKKYGKQFIWIIQEYSNGKKKWRFRDFQSIC